MVTKVDVSSSSRIIIASIMRPIGETGVQTHMQAFDGYLQDCGVPSTVVTPFDYHKGTVYPTFAVRKVLDRVSGTLSVWWYRRWHYEFLKLALRKHLAKDAKCIIYAQCPVSARAALDARTSRAQRVVMVVHFNESQAHEWAVKGKITRSGRMYSAIEALERSTLPALDGIVYVSEFMKNRIQQRIPSIAEVPFAVIPNFIPEPHRENSTVGELISIGALEPTKNQQFLIQVLACAKSLGRRFTLTLVGAGPDQSMLSNLAKALGVEEQVSFLGFRSDAASLIPGHRAYVHSAIFENLPIVLIESMACGVPVLAAPVGGIPEIYSDGVHGCYWSLSSPEHAATKLISLLENERLRECMGKAAYRRYRERFSPSVVGDQLHSFLTIASQEKVRASACF